MEKQETHRPPTTLPWILSISVSLILLLVLLLMWILVDQKYEFSPNRVTDTDVVSEKLQQLKQEHPEQYKAQALIKIPTGIFIQSFEFITTHTVLVSGYVWQTILKSDLEQGLVPGVTFPESKTAIDMSKAYDLDAGKYRVIGWHFRNAALLQNFDYSEYPFDKQEVWIRIWSKDFTQPIQLVPDFSSYPSTKPGSTFGLESDIVKQGFKIKETYFDMPLVTYNTNFGFPNEATKQYYVELYFNIMVQRQLTHVFLIHIIPILVIWCILFAITMLISHDREFSERVGFSTTQLFIALGGTVFSVILMNTSLRSGYADQPVLYIEYFYLITYIVIMLVSYDAYVMTTRRKVHGVLKHNLLPKTLFWPLILGAIVLATFLDFFIFPMQTH